MKNMVIMKPVKFIVFWRTNSSKLESTDNGLLRNSTVGITIPQTIKIQGDIEAVT